MSTSIGPSSRFSSPLRRYIPYSSYKSRITMHKQFCRFIDGTYSICDLKLFLQEEVQYARTPGKPTKWFIKQGTMWKQVPKP